jgi:serine-type D-Ala-D-Ala endopeptidase (penicillin-binding protein 7)
MSFRLPVSLGNILKRIASFLVTAFIALALSVPDADAATRSRAAAKTTHGKAHAGKAVASKSKAGKGVVTRGPVAKAAKSLSSSKHTASRRGVARSKLLSKRKAALRAPIVLAKPSFGEAAGLHSEQDALELKSGVALVVDQETREVLFSKNEKAVLPIASLTKLMTGMVLSEAKLPMDEVIMISQADVDTEKGSRSRLKVGTELSRGELLHLALMSSENRAAHALARTFPGGLPVFIRHMNVKAQALGMRDTAFTDPTGLSSTNLSSARDLAMLVHVAHANPLLRELSTSPGYQVAVGSKTLQFNNTNRLVNNPTWDIGLQKTGYISEAGQCLVMQTKVAGRKLIMVFLDSAGKLSRLGDAERVRRWLEAAPMVKPLAAAPLAALPPRLKTVASRS